MLSRALRAPKGEASPANRHSDRQALDTRSARVDGLGYPWLVTNRRAVILRATGLTAAALLMSGCAVFSPVQTDENYLPGDGTQLNMPGLELRNLVVVASEKGGPGVLVGQAVNKSDAPVQVSFAVEGSSTPTSATVPAHGEKGSASTPTSVKLDSVTSAPGGMVTVTISTREAGQNIVQVPVLLPNNQYKGLITAP